MTPLPPAQMRHPVPPWHPIPPRQPEGGMPMAPTSARLLRLLRLGRSRTSLKSSLRSASMRGMVLAVRGGFLRRRRCEGRRQPGAAGRLRTAEPGWLCADRCSASPVRTPCSYARAPRAPGKVPPAWRPGDAPRPGFQVPPTARSPG